MSMRRLACIPAGVERLFTVTSAPIQLKQSTRSYLDYASTPKSGHVERYVVPSDVCAPTELLQQILDNEESKDSGSSNDPFPPSAFIELPVVDLGDAAHESQVKGLVLRCQGPIGNHLILGYLHPPRPERRRGNAAFHDYDETLFPRDAGDTNNPQLSRHIVRKRAAERDVSDAINDGTDERPYLQPWPYPEEHLHTFPTRIHSIHVASGDKHSFGRRHSSVRLAIRTQASTVFVSLHIPRRTLAEGNGLHKVRMVGLCEIAHGRATTLRSGVRGARASSRHEQGIVPLIRADRTITDVAFHPYRHDMAFTVDSKGSVGLFSCDEYNVPGSGWSNCVAWTEKMPMVDHEDAPPKVWSIEWLAEEDCCLLADEKSVYLARHDLSQREVIYQASSECRISSMVTTKALISACWIVTTSEIVLLDARREFLGQQLSSCPHNRANGDTLTLTSVTSYSNGAVAILSSTKDRILSTVCVRISPHGPVASFVGEVGILPTALPNSELSGCPPILFSVDEMDEAWIKAMQGSTRPKHNVQTFAMLQISKLGGIWLSGLCAGTVEPGKSMYASVTLTEPAVERDGGEEDIVAARSLHSFSPLYKVLFANDLGRSSDAEVQNHDTRILQQARKWIRKTDHSGPYAFVANEVLALCGSGSKRLAPLNCFRNPLSSSALFREKSLRQQLENVQDSLSKELWSSGLETILHSQTLGMSFGQPDDWNECGDELAKLYLPSREEVRALVGYDQVEENVKSASDEVALDLHLSSRVFRAQPMSLTQETREKEDRMPLDNPPPFKRSFFTAPSHRDMSSDPDEKPVSRSARFLLSEWTLGSDLSTFEFRHPYEQATDVDDESQTTPSRHSSRRSSQTATELPTFAGQHHRIFTASPSSSRAVSEFPESAPALLTSLNGEQSSASNQSSQVPDIPAIAASQPISSTASQQRRRLRKKRLGGF